MFNIGIMELLVVLLVAFLVVGPKDLPKVARWIARQLKKLRRLVKQIKAEIGWDDFAAEWKDTKDTLHETVREADISGDLRETADTLKRGMTGVKQEIDHTADTIRQEIEGGN